MGLNEFWTWVDQLHRESDRERRYSDSWEGAEEDPRWRMMRDKREKIRGR